MGDRAWSDAKRWCEFGAREPGNIDHPEQVGIAAADGPAFGRFGQKIEQHLARSSGRLGNGRGSHFDLVENRLGVPGLDRSRLLGQEPVRSPQDRADGIRATVTVGVADGFDPGQDEHLVDVSVADQIRFDSPGPTHQPACLSGETGDDDLKEQPVGEILLSSNRQQSPHELRRLFERRRFYQRPELRKAPSASQRGLAFLPSPQVATGRRTARELIPFVVEDIENSL